MSDFYGNPINKNTYKKVEGQSHWSSPSNLAIVKYWGKHGRQLPSNPSVSITLSNAISDTNVTFSYDPKITKPHLEFFFEEKRNAAFESRIKKYIDGISDIMPFLRFTNLIIESKNTFPHSSGIASSASGFSALALCLVEIEEKITIEKNDDFLKRVSCLSRLGSGSACRSVYPCFACWGKNQFVKGSADEFATPILNFHPSYKGLYNDIIIVNKNVKTKSSSAGHQLMNDHVYRETRFDQARQRIGDVITSLSTGDLNKFGSVLESEALTLHALMLSSRPPYNLLAPLSIQIINDIWAFRKDTSIPVFFSMDAGPNVHVISFEEDRPLVRAFLSTLCHEYNLSVIHDKVGQGPINKL